MEVKYSRAMQRKLKDEKTIARYYGELKGKILFCISVLLASDCLEQVPNVPPTRRHKLVGQTNCWALDLSANWRMIVNGIDGQIPSSITVIEIIDIEDYH